MLDTANLIFVHSFTSSENVYSHKKITQRRS